MASNKLILNAFRFVLMLVMLSGSASVAEARTGILLKSSVEDAQPPPRWLAIGMRIFVAAAALFGLLGGGAAFGADDGPAGSLDALNKAPKAFVALGVSSFFLSGSRRKEMQGHILFNQECAPDPVPVPMASKYDLLRAHGGILGEAGCFAEPLARAGRSLDDLSLVRCYYGGARRLYAFSSVDLVSKNLVVRELQPKLNDAVGRVMPQIDGALRDIDGCFESAFGLSGWYARYGAKIMERLKPLTDVRITKR